MGPVATSRRHLLAGRRHRVTTGSTLHSKSIALGAHVTFKGAPGIGRVASVDDSTVTVEFFESVAEPSVGAVTLPASTLRRVPLPRQTRVFFRDGNGTWLAARVIADTADAQGRLFYYVRLPNSDQDVRVPGDRLFVRWDKPPQDPLQILLAGGNETPRFRDARLPVRTTLLHDRASCASATGISSSGVQMHGHQVAAAFRIIRDPVQRYLLADEVGMGKTIEAGFVIRQTLLDDPSSDVVVICPDALVEQWRAELADKFFVSDFGSRVLILSHDEPATWSDVHSTDLLVVDEVHLLTKVASPDDPHYSALARVAHKAKRVLLLSATPFSRDPVSHLALLHLLDAELFSWGKRAEFEQLLIARRELSRALYALPEVPDPENPELLEYQLNRLKARLPHDPLLDALAGLALSTFAEAPVDADALTRRVAAVRAHVSETYRLHQRVIRNRRHSIEYEVLDDEGLMAPFSFTGRRRPLLVPLESAEVDDAANFVQEWAASCGDQVLDHGLDARPFGAIVGILASRVGGPTSDLSDVMHFRLSEGSSGRAILSPEERRVIRGAPVLPFEERLLQRLERIGTDAVEKLAGAITKSTRPKEKVVVFCGRGTFASELARALQESIRGRESAFAHLSTQSAAEREAAVKAWRARGGVLVADESGDVGRNLQDAVLVVHARLAWNPNHLEQRIGRVDRYGRARASRAVVFTDSNQFGVLAAWAQLLLHGFGVFDRSISAEQEAAEEQAQYAWTTLLTDGVEAMLGLAPGVREAIAAETQRINEMDALEASWEVAGQVSSLAERISKHDGRHQVIERQFSSLITGAEGFRFDEQSWDGLVRFTPGERKDLLLSPPLSRLLQVDEVCRTGNFDRWKVKPGKRLFRRGNPFVDAVEKVLQLDDRGQASAFWRVDPTWQADALVYFGFDFLVEADPHPVLEVLEGHETQYPMALRRCDWAFPPLGRRVWIATGDMTVVSNREELRFLQAPFGGARDSNLNPSRIGALHNLLGPGNFESVGNAAARVAHDALLETTALKERCARAASRVASETDVLLARSRARSAAIGIVSDPESMGPEVALGRAVQAGVEQPLVRELAVTCVVRSAEELGSYA